MPSNVFPFIHLPTEIRLSIYRLALPHSEYHEGSDLERKDCPVQWHPGICPCILFVNRQTYREAAEILYRENVFAVYIRHPRAPRLRMGEGRADVESFMLISWAKRTWYSPKNPKVCLSVLRIHSNLQDIRRLHVSLPPFGEDLAGVDMYMKKTSYAAFNGINAWIRKCLKADGRIDDQERERMKYFQLTKEPIDEIGALLQELPRLDQLCLSFQSHAYDMTTTEYLLQGILKKRGIASVRCFYAGAPRGRRLEDFHYFVSLLQSTVATDIAEESHLPSDLDEMYFLLEAIRKKHERDPASVLPYINPMVR